MEHLAQASSEVGRRQGSSLSYRNLSSSALIAQAETEREYLESFSFVKDGFNVLGFNNFDKMDDEDRNDMILDLVEAIAEHRVRAEGAREYNKRARAKIGAKIKPLKGRKEQP